MKETLSSKFGDEVSPYLNEDGVIPEISYNKTRSAIHTSAVRSAGINPVLVTKSLCPGLLVTPWRISGLGSVPACALDNFSSIR
jgi:hypothetical protein